MKLVPGTETKERLGLLLKLTRVASEEKRQALFDHFVNGWPLEGAADLNGVDVSNFKKTVKKLNEVQAVVCQIEDIDFRHLRKGSEK